jgi:HEAT repeat protein
MNARTRVRFPTSPAGCRAGFRLLCAALIVALLGVAHAQSVGGAGAQPGKKPHAPPPSGNGGGIYVPPNDIGFPDPGSSGGDGDEGGEDEGGPGGPGNASGSRPPGEPGAGAGAPSGAHSRGSGGGGGAGATTGGINFLEDNWDVWWEANKFDFIDLRRIDDDVLTGQGIEPESPARRELRLAGVRATIREEVLPVLRSLAASDDPAVRSAAVVTLGKLRDEDSIDLVRGALGDGSLGVRRSSMLALGVLDTGRASWLLMNIADDSRQGRTLVSSSPISVDDRGTALITAALRGDAAAEPLLLQMLTERRDVHPELLSMVAGAAGLMGSAESIRPLIEIAFDDDLPQGVRSAAITALGRIGDPSVTPALMELLDGDVEPRRAAVVALGLVGHPGAARVIERLGGMLEHESDAVTRHFAAISLGRIGGAAARTRLLAAFESANSDMRPWLALALGVCERTTPNGEIVLTLLDRFKKESNTEVQAACLIGVGLCRSERGLAELTEVLRLGHVSLAGPAAIALGLSEQSSSAPALRQALISASNPDVLRQAALALGILGDTSSIPALLDLIRTTNNPFVASYSAIAVGFMGDADASPLLLQLIEREGPTGITTTYAVSAVGQLFDVDRRPALSRLAAGDNYLARPTAIDDLLDLGF